MNQHHLNFAWSPDSESPLSFLLSKFEQIAGIHASKLGVGIEELLKENKSWVMLGMNLRIHRAPRKNARLTLTTWPSKIVRFFTFRDFVIKNKAGEVIIEARTQWVLLDMVKRRPLPIPSHLNSIVENAIELFDFEKVGNIKNQSFFKVEGIEATSSHTDINEHVNNKFYIEWAFDLLTEGNSITLPKTMIAEFLKESFVGDEISIELAEGSDIARLRTDENVLFVGKFSF